LDYPEILFTENSDVSMFIEIEIGTSAGGWSCLFVFFISIVKMTVIKKHILVVDDETLLVRLSKRQLENGGYRVSVSTTSHGALELVLKDSGKYDLLLTDLTMPGLSGIELIQKTLAHVPTLPVIVVTGMLDPEIETQLHDLGVKMVLLKPLVDNNLVLTVGRVLAESEKRKSTKKPS
jgi:CheY-like chemotaxis protein